MKDRKEEMREELQLLPVQFEEAQTDLLKAMSLNELLAALELIIEIEQFDSERSCPSNNQNNINYLH